MNVLARYPSKSTPGKLYNVIEGHDGVVYCDCWAWKRNRTCEHLEMYHSGGIIPTPQPRQPLPVVKNRCAPALQSIIDDVVRQLGGQ